MSLIAILLSLIVERFLGSMAELRRFGWFHRYSRFLARGLRGRRYLNGDAAVLLLLLPPLLLTAAIDYYLGQLWFLFALAFAVLVLLLSFGPCDLEAEVEAFVDASERGDEESAVWHAGELIGDELPEHSAQLTRRIMESTLAEANERLLAVIFWFVLLGPAGALLYRLSQQLLEAERDEDDTVAEAALRLHHLLAWIPARLCALAYALAGSFVEAIQAWRNEPAGWPQSTRLVLIAAGFGALRFEPEELEEDNTAQHIDMVNETLALVRRAVMVFISAIALFTLAGWMA
jgi:membrane protein required for beta-lactamase induction